MTRGRVIRKAAITRAMVRADPDTIYVFGDNMIGKGFGGQAREMRGEPNAVGVPTKWRPAMDEGSYFTDADLDNRDVYDTISRAFLRMDQALEAGRNVVIPSDGLGTGLAQLSTRAPAIDAFIRNRIGKLVAGGNNA